MTVFKNYFKIVWAHKISIVLYTIIFAVILIFSTESDKKEIYESVDINVYVKDNANTELSRALKNYIDKSDNIIDMDESLVEDKLFYRIINAAVEFPENFDETREVLYKGAPGDMYGMSIKEKVNQYLSQVQSYEKAGFSKEDAIKYTDEDLDKKFTVAIKNSSGVNRKDNSNFYFNFLNYLILSQVILIVSTIVKVYKKKILAMRNSASPMPLTKMNFQLILGHVVTGIMLWAIYILLFVVLYRYDFSKPHINLMMLNFFVFTISVVSMSMMISNLIKNQNAISGVANVVSLGSSFLCGAFVPQEMLGDTALTIGKIFPSYYYIKNNDMLFKDPSFSSIKTNILIMLAFTFVFVIMTIITKPKTNDTINKN